MAKKTVSKTKKTVSKPAKKTPAAKKTALPKAKVKTKIAKKPVIKPRVKAKAEKKTIAKAKKVAAIPKGYNAITPYLIVNNGSKAIEFYKKAFGAKEVMRMDKAGGKVQHAELQIGDAKIMLADECEEMGAGSPHSIGGSPVSIHLYTKNVDNTVKLAQSAGAKLLRPVEDMFYGDRSGTVEDPFGHKWHVSTHIEDVSKATMKKRAAEFGKKA